MKKEIINLILLESHGRVAYESAKYIRKKPKNEQNEDDTFQLFI